MTILPQFFRLWRFRRRVARLHRALGIPADYADRHALPLQPEARRLEPAGLDIYRREQRLVPPAAAAWRAMAAAAASDGIDLQLVSAFRSVAYQEGILRRKRDRGQAIEEILRVSAAPGYSEHHSGRAVDVATADCEPLEECFEDTDAYAWLDRNAARFGFRLSYPRNNRHRIAFEPWHWYWTGG